MAEGSAGGQEQIPREVAVARSRKRPRSQVWEHFTRFTTADGKDKAKCNNCSAEFVADNNKHGNSHISRHDKSCRELWEHFTRVTTADGEDRAKCNTCSAELVADTKLLSRHDKSCRELWEHFTRVATADGEDRAKCNTCSAELVADTKLLWRHDKSCRKQATDGTRGEHPPRPRAASESSNLNPDDRGACEDLARMLALHGYDSSLVEDGYFRSFVRRLNPDFQLPSRRTVEEICDGVSDEAARDLRSKLERTSGRVNLAFGTAQTVEGTVFYMACHFIDDEWKLHKMIMDVYMVVPDFIFHGPLLGIREVCLDDDDSGGALMDTIFTCHIEHKVFSTAVRNDADYLPMRDWMYDNYLSY